ncbi:MAG: hypothetical protein Q8R18_00770 [bacterium]|nr:hypothetical protein [bacterium]
MHIKNLQESFRFLRKNPILYLPDILMTAVTSILLYYLYLYTNASGFLALFQSTELASFELIKVFLSENLKEIIISAVTFFLVTFIFGVGVIIFKFSMIREMLIGKKISLINSWKERRGFFWPVVFLRVIVYFLSLISIIIVSVISLGVYFLLFSLNENLALWLAFAVWIILGILVLIYIKLAILFRYPIMFLKQTKQPIQIIKESYKALKEQPKYLLETWLIVIVLTIIFWAINYILGTLIEMSLSFLSIITLVTILSLLWRIINILIGITVDIWTTIYVFLRFKEKTKQ